MSLDFQKKYFFTKFGRNIIPGLNYHRSKDIEFTTRIPPDSSKKHYDQYLYNTPLFLKTHSPKDPIVFSIIDLKADNVLAQCIFTISDGIALSPEIGPFGSIEMDHSVQPDLLIDFIFYIQEYFQGREINQIIIKNYASFQSEENALKLKKVFSRSGYVARYADINHHITLTAENFDSFIHPMEKRKLVKCKKEGVVIRQAEPDEFELVHEFISTCRKERNLEININKEQFLKIMHVMHEHYYAFIGLIKGEIIAATVCVRVNKEILYNYLPASAKKFNSMSPLVMIMEGVYEFARSMDYKYIDLGVSSVAGRPQQGLITFKERIGGKASEKITYSKLNQN